MIKAAKRNNKKEERGIVKNQVVGLWKINCGHFLNGKGTNSMIHQWLKHGKNCFDDRKGFQRKQQRDMIKAAKRNDKKEERGIIKNQAVGSQKINCSIFFNGKGTNLMIH